MLLLILHVLPLLFRRAPGFLLARRHGFARMRLRDGLHARGRLQLRIMRSRDGEELA